VWVVGGGVNFYKQSTIVKSKSIYIQKYNRYTMSKKGPKTLKGVIRKIYTGDGRKLTLENLPPRRSI